MTIDREDRLRHTRTARRSLVVGAVTASLGVAAACGLATQSITATGSSGAQTGQSGRSGTTGPAGQGIQQGQSLHRSQQSQQSQSQTFQQAPPPQPGSGSAPQAQSSGS